LAAIESDNNLSTAAMWRGDAKTLSVKNDISEDYKICHLGEILQCKHAP